ncbi:alpha/beta fold hydrolase [Bradyrhizobium sp. SSUT77]|uniref:esterase/lipase family protein n=1 Tax=Bradyrhizobium sp. SSUT77 TaxID=3040603 RepID=UPI002448D7A1|nr:alpha/beta fold hydrolase [Bradyrhizobium sp. SSUT77]MDH2348701.1 alpha/beta fold hydrolase [Bradyrhizobium sp. SSUT77]
MAEPELVSVYKAETATGDVIFVHGLEGDHSSSWAFDRPNSWGGWLSTNRPDLNIWSLKYDVHASEWTGHSMPLSDRALNVLALFDNNNIGSRPIVFVCHSMGGLLAKELIRHSITVTPRFKRIAEQTRGIVFFSTPHAGSALAGIAQFLKYVLRTTRSISELAPHEARLRDLNIWFRNNYGQLNIRPYIFFETQNTHGVRVVDETSSDGGYPQSSPIPIDANHITITKPRNYQHITVGQTIKLIDEAIPSSSYSYHHERDFPDNPELPNQTNPPPLLRRDERNQTLLSVLIAVLFVILDLSLNAFPFLIPLGFFLVLEFDFLNSVILPLIAGSAVSVWLRFGTRSVLFALGFLIVVTAFPATFWATTKRMSWKGGNDLVEIWSHAATWNDLITTCTLAGVFFIVPIAISWLARRRRERGAYTNT